MNALYRPRISIFIPLILFALSSIIYIFGLGEVLGGLSFAALFFLAVVALGVVLYPSLPVVILYPLLWCTWSYNIPGLGKSDLILGYMSIVGLFVRVIIRREPLPKLPRMIFIGVLMVFTSLIFPWMLSSSFVSGFAYIVSLFGRVFFMYLVYVHLNSTKKLRLSAFMMVLSSILYAFVVLYISIRYDFGYSRIPDASQRIVRDMGLLAYRISTGFTAAGASVILLLGLYADVKKWYWRGIMLVIAFFLLWMTFAAEYRREILISFAILFLYMSIKPSFRIRSASLFLLIANAFLFFVILLPNSIVLQERLNNETDKVLAGEDLRQISYRAGMSAFLDSPLLGSGPGAYDDVVTRRVDPKYYLPYGLRRVSAFNLFVAIAVEGGLFGLVGIGLILLGAYLRVRFISSHSSSVHNWILRCAPIILLQIILWSIFANSWEASIIWYLLGLILAAARLAEQRSLDRTEAELIGEL